MVKTLIDDGDNVIFKREGSSRIYQIRKNRQVHFSRAKFSVEELIGQPYGSTFELDHGKIVRVDPQAAGSAASDWSLDQDADNRNLLDTDKNQKMSKDDIMKMKDEGATGEKIIEELIENSETFKTKTEFSKAKYLKKKKKKHMLFFSVHRPTPRLIMEMYTKEPGKLNFLRADSLSQLLSYSNVMYGSRVAVLESCQGLIVASMLQRMGGQGKLIQLVANNLNPPQRNIVDHFSFPKEHLDNLYTFPLDQLSTLTADSNHPETAPFKDKSSDTTDDLNHCASETVGQSVKAEPATSQEKPSDATDEANYNASETIVQTMHTEPSKPEEDDKMDCDSSRTEDPSCGEGAEGSYSNGEKPDVTEGNGDNTGSGAPAHSQAQEGKPFVKNRELQRIARAKRQKEAGDIVRSKQLDSLVIACKQNPVPILVRMLEHMGPSRTVVVYSQFLDPLIECYTYVKEKHLGIQLRLSDTWLREYQVLPQRTHPKVNMSGTGGYLLTFLTTEPSH